MDKIQLIKMLNWNISVDSDIAIDKVIDQLKGFPKIPEELINQLEQLKFKGHKKIDKFEMIEALEKV